MGDAPNTTVTVFTQLFAAFDDNLMGMISSGSANIISLITPLMAAGFSIYVLLILLSYWRGTNDEPVSDFLKRMAAWTAILTFGMNISYYSNYVVPFFNGLGDDLARALSGTPSTGSALDSITTAYVQAMVKIYQEASGIEDTMNAIAFVFVTLLFALPFIAIAAAYIILAKFALGLLLALGPAFIAAALFPATRRLFDSWAGQCLNYGILVALFAAAGMLEIRFAQTIVPTDITILSLFQLVMMGIAFVIISLNLPSLASQLAGGVGISSMVGKLSGVGRLAAALGKGASGGGGSSPNSSGGQIKGK
ncbi:type IV secretion system protein [Paraburkholderia susongensis]|uniref:Type IV secretion system protein VirB6 n=1 Tax=Paraburkholderia susongensis TaxID=1515439 RepID=A0A1X7M721_9BURK|nr:type IV secretion system protein [Paraburkholderia susongensis]SMG61564.1 type IV secretion system protein VirB6 [Paraburkholderia susongensis]